MPIMIPPVRRLLFLLLIVFLSLAIAAVVAWWGMIRMPGKSFAGEPQPLTADEIAIREEMRGHVQKLAGEIGPRGLHRFHALQAAADYIAGAFVAAGFQPRREAYDVQGRACENIDVELKGTKSEEILVIGAHYDTVPGSPGANDNTSGVAATLALARRFADKPCARTVRFVAFVNEEPGHFQTQQMGSWVYANSCKERSERIAGMISLETIAYFSDEPGSQKYPVPLLDKIYPGTGNFIAFVGNVSSGALVRETVGSFRRHAQVPSEGTALPSNIPGIGWSDHWAFWQHGYAALMVTDTAPFRYPYYHSVEDTPDKLDYDTMTRVVSALEKVIRDLADAGL
jgi:hypothetical protein